MSWWWLENLIDESDWAAPCKHVLQTLGRQINPPKDWDASDPEAWDPESHPEALTVRYDRARLSLLTSYSKDTLRRVLKELSAAKDDEGDALDPVLHLAAPARQHYVATYLFDLAALRRHRNPQLVALDAQRREARQSRRRGRRQINAQGAQDTPAEEIQGAQDTPAEEIQGAQDTPAETPRGLKMRPPFISSLSPLKNSSPSPPTPPLGAEETAVEVEVAPFDQFWKAYPKHQDITDARAVWLSLNPNHALLAQILQALTWQRERWAQAGYRFVPKPAKWLRDHKWLDPDPDQARRPRDDDAPEPSRCQAGDGHRCRDAPGGLSLKLCDTHALQSIRDEAEALVAHLLAPGWDLEARLRQELARTHNGQGERFWAAIDWAQAHTVDSLMEALVTLQAQVVEDARAAADGEPMRALG